MKLRRELGLVGATLYGIGVIVGAGIYSLIGIGAGLSGNMLWLSFLLGAIVAFFTGLSYAELSSLLPKEAAEYHYTRLAFGHESWSFIVDWILAVAYVLFASTVALAFAGYLSALTGTDIKLLAFLIVIFMGLLNYIGIKLTSVYNDFCAILSVAGLAIVAIAVLSSKNVSHVNLLQAPAGGLPAIVSSVAVMFFAYVGFQNIANISEEVKDSKRTVPLAIMLSLGVSTFLYLLVAIASVMAVDPSKLAQSTSPLALVVSTVSPALTTPLLIIAIFATSNTILIALISSSRILFGMSSSGSMPKQLSGLSRRGTPTNSIIVTTVAAALATAILGLKVSAELTDLGIFVGFFAVNLSLLALRDSKISHGFRSPRLLGFPVFALLGAITTFIMLVYLGFELWVAEAIIMLIGIFLYSPSGK